MKGFQRFLLLLTCFWVVFLDGFGQAVLFPILSKILTLTTSISLFANYSLHQRGYWYGVIIAIYFIGWFIGAPILADLSDRYGRRKALQLCLLGTTFGYAFSLYAFAIQSLWLLLAGRLLTGLMAGNMAIAQATISDSVSSDRKAVLLGWTQLVMFAGIVIGPLCAAYLEYADALYIGVLLSLVGLVMTFSAFKVVGQINVSTRWFDSLKVFSKVMRQIYTRYLLWCFLLLQLGWYGYYFYMTEYMAYEYGMGAIEAGWFYVILGAGISFGVSVLIKLLQNCIQKRQAIILGYCVIGLSVLATVAYSAFVGIWVLPFIIGAAQGLAYGFFLKLLLEYSGPHHTGRILGIASSMSAVAAAMGSLFGGFIGPYHINAPLIIAVIFILFGVLFMWRFYPIE